MSSVIEDSTYTTKTTSPNCQTELFMFYFICKVRDASEA